MKHTTMPLSRSILGLCGLAAGAYCAFAAFQNGCSLAHGIASCVSGAAFASAVIASWFLLHAADSWSKAGEYLTAWLVRGLWLLAMTFVVVNAVIFTATTRTEHVGEKALTIEAYDRANATRATALADLTTVKTNPRWTMTNGCTNVTTEKSKQFCANYAATFAAQKSADMTLASGKPASADAGAETLAWVLGADAATVARALPIGLGIALEFFASFFMKLALKTPGRRRENEAVKLEPAKPIPALTINGPLPAIEYQPLKVLDAKFAAPRKAKTEPAPRFGDMASFFPKLDGRNLRAKRFIPAND